MTGCREVFHGADVGIIWHDAETNVLHHLYMVELGERITVEPRTPTSGGPFERIAETRRPQVMKTWAEVLAAGYVPRVRRGRNEMSLVDVPIIGSDRVLGLISLADFEQRGGVRRR